MRLRLLKPLVPPVLADLVSRARSAVSFSGEFASWEAAAARAEGYDAQEITERTVAATRRVVAGEAVYERDSVTFDHIEYSWPLLACLLQVGLERGSLRVADFGGSLGSTWRQNSRYLQRLRIPLSWHVIEQEHLVTLGNEEFPMECFASTIASPRPFGTVWTWCCSRAPCAMSGIRSNICARRPPRRRSS